MRVRVECYAGYQYPERPLRFYLGGREFLVEEVLDRWYGPDYTYFRVRASDGHCYILRHTRHEAEEEWTLQSFLDWKYYRGASMSATLGSHEHDESA